jgi:hypothetical protein
MAYEEAIRSVTLLADASVGVYTGPPGLPGSPSPHGGALYTLARITGANQVGLTKSAGDVVVGVIQNKPQTVGEATTVAIRGISKVVAGDVVTAGAEVTSDNAGRVIPVAQLSATTNLSGSITKSGSNVSYTSTSHGLSVGSEVLIAGTTSAANSGSFIVTATADANTFTVVNSAGVAESAAGTVRKVTRSGKVVGIALDASGAANEVIPVLLKL